MLIGLVDQVRFERGENDGSAVNRPLAILNHGFRFENTAKQL